MLIRGIRSLSLGSIAALPTLPMNPSINVKQLSSSTRELPRFGLQTLVYKFMDCRSPSGRNIYFLFWVWRDVWNGTWGMCCWCAGSCDERVTSSGGDMRRSRVGAFRFYRSINPNAPDIYDTLSPPTNVISRSKLHRFRRLIRVRILSLRLAYPREGHSPRHYRLFAHRSKGPSILRCLPSSGSHRPRLPLPSALYYSRDPNQDHLHDLLANHLPARIRQTCASN
jgi:hypothetical protein